MLLVLRTNLRKVEMSTKNAVFNVAFKRLHIKKLPTKLTIAITNITFKIPPRFALGRKLVYEKLHFPEIKTSLCHSPVE